MRALSRHDNESRRCVAKAERSHPDYGRSGVMAHRLRSALERNRAPHFREQCMENNPLRTFTAATVHVSGGCIAMNTKIPGAIP